VKYSLRLQPADMASLTAMDAAVRRADALDFGSVWSSEAGHDPFIAMPLAAAASPRLKLGTGVAVAYGRSPFATAQVAWDIQRYSEGRFRLGLSTQVKAHIERRYGAAWPGGVSALRDYVECCRAVWRAWQTGEKPAFRGSHYQFTLMNPEFDPGIPVWLAAVGPASARLAGEIGEGLHVHAFHTESYLRDVVLPALAEGQARAGRPLTIEAACPVLSGIVHDNAQEREMRDVMRRHVAFYASTPAYLPVLAHAGFEEIHAPLRALSREGGWDRMAEMISDDILDAFAVFDAPRRLGERLAAKYAGVLSEIAVYKEGVRFASDEDLAALITGLAAPRR
jgi:probable F420-dependent oxidoreductase